MAKNIQLLIVTKMSSICKLLHLQHNFVLFIFCQIHIECTRWLVFTVDVSFAGGGSVGE